MGYATTSRSGIIKIKEGESPFLFWSALTFYNFIMVQNLKRLKRQQASYNFKRLKSKMDFEIEFKFQN
jgi:hypothetical protein